MGNISTTANGIIVYDIPTKFVFNNYSFHVLTPNDVKVIKYSCDGERMLYRNNSCGPLLWVLKPKDIQMKNITDMKNGIVYFNSSSPYLTRTIFRGYATKHTFIDRYVEETLYMDHCYSKYFVLFACDKMFYSDIASNIARLYISSLVK